MHVAYLSDRDGAPAIPRLREQGVEPAHVPVANLGVSAVRSMRRHIDSVRPDVVHAHLGTSDFTAGWAARSSSVPAVSTLHAMVWSRTGRSGVKERLFALSRRVGMQRVIAVSEFARDGYLKTGWDRPGRVITVRNGVVGAARPGSGARVRAELGLPADAPVVGMLTALRPEKNHAAAAAAIMRLRERLPDVRLLIVGDGPSRDEVAAAVAPLGDAAVLTGYRSDVMEVLDAMDVLLHPPTADALPTALIEALAASVPIVATTVGGIPEIVEDGTSGILVGTPDPETLAVTLERVLGSADLRRELAEAGRARFDAEFAAGAWAGRLHGVYAGLLAGRPRRPAA
jgi:glycosyltransferase involved in cell wall biosynthesis